MCAYIDASLKGTKWASVGAEHPETHERGDDCHKEAKAAERARIFRKAGHEAQRLEMLWGSRARASHCAALCFPRNHRHSKTCWSISKVFVYMSRSRSRRRKDVERVRRDEVTADRVCTELVEIGVPPDPRRFLPPIEGTLNVRPKQGGISGALVAHYPLLLER